MENENVDKKVADLPSRPLKDSTAQELNQDALCDCGQPRKAHSLEPPHGCETSKCDGFYRFVSSTTVEKQAAAEHLNSNE